MTDSESLPKSFWLNKKEMAASLGISLQSFDRWRVEPDYRTARDIYFSCRSVLDNRLEHERKKAENSRPTGDENSIIYQELRLTTARAQQLEIKNDIAQGKLVPIDLITKIISEVANEAAGYLDTIPQKLKRKYPDLDTQMIEAVKWHIVKAMNSIAEIDESIERVISDYNTEQETHTSD